MITLLNAKPEDKIPAVAAEDLKQGQYCLVAALDGDDYSMEAIDAVGDPVLDRNHLYMVVKETINIEGGDEVDWETIASGAHLIAIGAVPGLIIEDSMLSTNNTAADWANASLGTAMIVNASGFPTLDGASDDVANASQIGKFIKYENGIVWYELVGSDIVVA